MGSKREEERNEKIIRGLMKLPPNRRCINCNSLGPQYVCTNFWTFVCTTCSGIHREFTHRVKSVSMAKFTFQEVDALQKGGNQRARELYLKAWDPQRQRLPDNSNVDKVRELIKNVYVDKKYAVEKSSDRPPRDPQSIRNHEDETRRASSYHSYSQSPPYDFQYEERRYGKHAPSLTRKGSDRGIYEGKLSNFLSPSRFNDQANDDRFANEGSYPRASDYSVSSGGDPFRSDVLSPSSQRDVGSPFSETSRDFSSEIQGHQTELQNLQSFKSVNSMKLQEVASQSGHSAETSHAKTSSVPSPPQSSAATSFQGLDLFDAPYAPQNATSSNSKLPESSLDKSVDLFQQSPISSVPTFNEQQPPQTREPSVLDLFTVVSQQQPGASSNGKTSDVATPNNGGWATFDMPQSMVPVGSENSAAATVSSSGGNIIGNFNPFSLDQSSSHQNSVSHEPSASTNAFWHDGLQNVETATNNTQFWNAFEDSAGQQPIQNAPKSAKQAAVHSTSDANKSLGLGLYEAFMSDGNVTTPDEREHPPSSLSSNFDMPLHEFSVIPAVAGVHSLATEHKVTNPFDIPFDSDMESSNMSQFWDMSALQTALPNSQAPAPYVGGANQSWFPQNPVSSYVPGGVAFDPPSGSLGFISGQTPSTQISNVPAQGSVASIGGNPFA